METTATNLAVDQVSHNENVVGVLFVMSFVHAGSQ